MSHLIPRNLNIFSQSYVQGWGWLLFFNVSVVIPCAVEGVSKLASVKYISLAAPVLQCNGKMNVQSRQINLSTHQDISFSAQYRSVALLHLKNRIYSLEFLVSLLVCEERKALTTSCVLL